jgi:hypothetical protein
MTGGKREATKHDVLGVEPETAAQLENDLDSLFKLPLTEFIAERNALASRLKKAGRGDEAAKVKELAKPTSSAWAVNQLYWKYHDSFTRMLAAGEQLAQAHASQFAGKAASTSGLLAARREALTALARLAGPVLRDAGHNPTPDMMRRITTTLEALSAYSSLPNAPRPGRLSSDVDPPGFDSLAALIPRASHVERTDELSRITQQSATRGTSKEKEGREQRMASARAALQAAEREFREARANAHKAGTILKKATAHANESEKDRQEAAERFETAKAVAEAARQHAQLAAAEAEKAQRALENAEARVQKERAALQYALPHGRSSQD